MQFVTGILISIGGFLIIVFREKLQRVSGDIAFAEKYLGSGGTFGLFVIIGILLFIVGLMWAFGTLDAFSESVIGPLFGK